jgi:hypothetical protein
MAVPCDQSEKYQIYDWASLQSNPELLAEAKKKTRAGPSYSYLVRDNRIIGFIDIFSVGQQQQCHGRPLYRLGQITVDKSERHQGVGRLFFDAMCKKLLKEDCCIELTDSTIMENLVRVSPCFRSSVGDHLYGGEKTRAYCDASVQFVASNVMEYFLSPKTEVSTPLKYRSLSGHSAASLGWLLTDFFCSIYGISHLLNYVDQHPEDRGKILEVYLQYKDMIMMKNSFIIDPPQDRIEYNTKLQLLIAKCT